MSGQKILRGVREHRRGEGGREEEKEKRRKKKKKKKKKKNWTYMRET